VRRTEMVTAACHVCVQDIDHVSKRSMPQHGCAGTFQDHNKHQPPFETILKSDYSDLFLRVCVFAPRRHSLPSATATMIRCIIGAFISAE
jgi:hypothetical protein